MALDVSCQHPSPITSHLALTVPPPLQVPVLKPMDLMVEVSPRRVFANGHTYHINSISVNSDCETYMSADDLRINLWHLAITDRSFSILSGCAPTPAHGLHRRLGSFCLVRPLQRGTTWLSQCVKKGQIWNHDEFIYEKFKIPATEGYI